MSQAESSSIPPKGVRWGWIISGLILIAIIAGLWMRDMDGNIQYYMTVSEYKADQQKYNGKKIKLAGKVKQDSLKSSGQRYEFIVEDQGSEISVVFVGLAPDTFKNGSEVVVEGRGRIDDTFEAHSLMAKCASKYQAGDMPPLESMRSKSMK